MAKVRCRSCSFVRLDPSSCEGSLCTYECGNPKSEFHKALVNVTKNGDIEAVIRWSGCEHGLQVEKTQTVAAFGGGRLR